MRVINEGKGDNPVIGEFTCTGAGNGHGGCDALLEIELNDLRLYKSSDMYGDANPDVYCFRCPICETLTDIPRGRHPKGKQASRVTRFSNKWKEEGVDDWVAIACARAHDAGLDTTGPKRIRFIEFVIERLHKTDPEALVEYAERVGYDLEAGELRPDE